MNRDLGLKCRLNCRQLRESYTMAASLYLDLESTGALMQMLNKIRSFSLALGVSVAMAAGAPAYAQHAGHVGGGYGGGFHGGYGGGFHGGYGGWHGGYGYGGYGWRGGYGYGWRGGYWGPWGWGLGGLGLGLYFATPPYYYSTYWWGGVPYYYADNTYYRWNDGVSQYETVAPPAGIQNQGGVAAQGAAAPSDLIVYPKNGQTQEQLGKDKFECYRWAVGQTGFDPTQPGGGAAPGNRSNYLRAQAACLEGRGYSVK
jgi:hypothetical protein